MSEKPQLKKPLIYIVSPCESFDSTARKAWEVSRRLNITTGFYYCDISFVIEPDSDLEQILDKGLLVIAGCIQRGIIDRNLYITHREKIISENIIKNRFNTEIENVVPSFRKIPVAWY